MKRIYERRLMHGKIISQVLVSGDKTTVIITFTDGTYVVWGNGLEEIDFNLKYDPEEDRNRDWLTRIFRPQELVKIGLIQPRNEKRRDRNNANKRGSGISVEHSTPKEW